MSYTNFKPIVWSEMIDRELEKNLIFGRLANRQYEGNISEHGTSVTVPRISATTVGDYTGAEITFEEDAGAKQVILIDKSKYFALTMDDIDKAQALNGVLDLRTVDAIYRMADKVDIELAKMEAKVVAANRNALALDGKILAGLRAVKKTLDKNNVSTVGRWIVISPDVEERLLEELTNTVLPQTADFSTINGYVGKLYGMEILVSNNVQEASSVHKCLAGTTASLHLAMQLSQVKAGEHEKTFGEFVKGLNLFGCDVAETEVGYTSRLATLDVSFV